MLWAKLVGAMVWAGWCPMGWGTCGDGVGEEEPPTAAPSAFSQLKLRAILTPSMWHCARLRCQVPPGLCQCCIPPVQGCPGSCCRIQAVIPARHRAVLPAACGLSYNCNACFGNAEPKPGWNLTMSRVRFGQLHSKSGIASLLKI